MNKPSVDYLIVGLGLAGSCMALQMMKRGRSFVVIDEPGHNKSTLVAAGLFNPVTGQNLVKTWMADVLFPYLAGFYRAAELLTGKSFFHPMPLYRPFSSVAEQNEWMGRSADPEFREIIESISPAPSVEGVRDPFGGLMLKNSGFLDTNMFVAAVCSKIAETASFRSTGFDYSKLVITGSGVSYEDISASRVIFCEGVRVISNPWFGQVPVRPLKGETIQIKSDYKKHVIINRGVYMVPGSNAGQWRVGSTYHQKDRTETATAAARLELELKLNDLVSFSFQITSQDWGIRPTTTDRRPILGKHPEFEPLYIFNGLGTKGVSLAPYFSEVLLQWIENPREGLNKEVDVTRFKSLY